MGKFEDEEEIDEELLNFKTKFELLNKKPSPHTESCIEGSQGIHKFVTYLSI